MSKRLICAAFAIALAVSTPVIAQGRNDDSDLRASRGGGSSPISRIVKAFKQAIQDLYEITVPHP